MPCLRLSRCPATIRRAHQERLRVRLISRLRAGTFDARIRAGEPLDAGEALACRAHRLTSRRTRNMVADGLQRAARRAALPADASLSTRIPVQREAAYDALRPLTDLVHRLQDEEPPARAQGVALALRLLTDGTAPLHAPSEPGTLREAVRVALEACDRRVEVLT